MVTIAHAIKLMSKTLSTGLATVRPACLREQPPRISTLSLHPKDESISDPPRGSECSRNPHVGPSEGLLHTLSGNSPAPSS